MEGKKMSDKRFQDPILDFFRQLLTTMPVRPAKVEINLTPNGMPKAGNIATEKRSEYLDICARSSVKPYSRVTLGYTIKDGIGLWVPRDYTLLAAHQGFSAKDLKSATWLTMNAGKFHDVRVATGVHPTDDELLSIVPGALEERTDQGYRVESADFWTSVVPGTKVDESISMGSGVRYRPREFPEKLKLDVTYKLQRRDRLAMVGWFDTLKTKVPDTLY
jgi:hypothetical protein